MFSPHFRGSACEDLPGEPPVLISGVLVFTCIPYSVGLRSVPLGWPQMQVPKGKQPTGCTWDSLFNTVPPARPPGINKESPLTLGESVVSVSGDTCSNGSWVFYNTHCVRSQPLQFALAELSLQEDSPSKVTRIFKIITGGTHTRRTYVILEPWEISASRDERYGMPTLHRDQ